MRKLLLAKTLLKVLTVFSLLALTSLGVWLIGIHLRAEYHLRQSRQLLERQRYQRALAQLKEALRFQPRNYELHLLAGRVARQGGSYSAAKEHLHQCRSLQKAVSADLQLEEHLLRAQLGQLEEVSRYLAPYLYEEGPQTPLVLEALSHVYLYTYRFDRAWQCLHRWLELEPDNVEALFLRGTYYDLKSNDQAAVADLHRVLELDPERLAARLLLARTLQEHYHATEAIKEFQILLNQAPNCFPGRVGLASCYVEGNQWPEARSCLEQLPPDKWDDPEVLYLRGLIAKGEGKFDEAISFLQAALAANPAKSLACYQLALCYQHQGEEASAAKYQDRFDRIDKDQKRLLAITNDEQEALKSNPALCCELGEVCLRLGIKERGLYWLNAALRLNPRHRQAHQQLLRYYERLGPEGESKAQFHRRTLGQSTGSTP